MNEILTELSRAIIDGQAEAATSQVQAAIDAGIEPTVILNDGMIAAMREVGRRFESGQYYVPEMLIAARAMKNALALLEPRLKQADVKPAGKVIAGTVRGDLHDIGKNLVCMMLQGAGFEILDLGNNVAPDKFVAAAGQDGIPIVALSALLTTTMPAMKETVDAFVRAGLRDRVKIIVGGAPVTEAFARAIGADGFAPDASRAVSLAQSLLAAA